MEQQTLRGDEARELSEKLLHMYYSTVQYPWTRHHIESFDQFLASDLPAIIKAANPILILQDQIGNSGEYRYKAEIFVGGLEGDKLQIGTPSISLQGGNDVRLLFPNEARLRNLTYSSQILADFHIRVTFTEQKASGQGVGFNQSVVEMHPGIDEYKYLANMPLFQIPIMLHSRYCVLNQKPESFLKEAGECIYDYGGYFIVNGSEKVLITRQEQSFNTLYVQNQEREPQVATYASISCLNPTTRQVKRVSFGLLRRQKTLQVSIPFVRKPIPIFVLFRALGVQADEDILRLIFPNPNDAETIILEPLLQESVVEAVPFLDTFSAIQYIKVLTKGFSEAHVLDILHNQLFIHVEDRPLARAYYLAECVRKILRVHAGLDPKTDRDDTRNQRCLSSGFLTRMLFQGVYSTWKKVAFKAIDQEFKYNKGIYSGQGFLSLFTPANLFRISQKGDLSALPDRFITQGLMRGFKGKWGSGVGEEKTGVLQALSRLSYMDFLSHCRRVVLDFDTGMKLAGPRRLHTSQFGYFCTNETPGGASIGITKNLSNLATISIAMNPAPFIQWLLTRGGVISCENVTPDLAAIAVPVFVNGGIIGFTVRPMILRDVVKLMKWTGCMNAFTSIAFVIREKKLLFYLDEGRPVRPLIHLEQRGALPLAKIQATKSWRDAVLGSYPDTKENGLSNMEFLDPLAAQEAPTLEMYVELMKPYTGFLEYVDPYEANEAYVACFTEHIQADTTHMEVHPSTIFGLMTSVIPYANHNQSPRNQLSCSQSKQGLSIYATNYANRFDNQVHVLSYPQGPIVRTHYYDYVANGKMGYGQNIILAMGVFSGYNQEDGIVFNADAIQRGLFHSTCYRSYTCCETDDPMTKASQRIANPVKTPKWVNLKPGLDYTKLDDRGIIREGEMVDENTVLVGRYIEDENGTIQDASTTAQVWTTGRVEKIAVMIGNNGLALVKVRVAQYRVPELGDKFSNRHGQKGTMGMMIRGHDMPRSASGIVPDMIMNSHAIPSRMTMAQLLESLLGKTAALGGAIGNATTFMNEGSPAEAIGKVLQEQFGMQPMGEELLYDGTTGVMIPSTIFMGNVYTMRLKHMTEDKWNARADGRREQRTHQPTGGRGNQGGLRIGEMERDAIVGHGIMSFVRESYMKRADGSEFLVCNSCGTIPISNERKGLIVCPMCDGPLQYIGDSANTFELLPPVKRSTATFSKVEMPYAFKLLEQELATYMNIGMRILTTRDLQKLNVPGMRELTEEEQAKALALTLPVHVMPDTRIVEFTEEEKEEPVATDDLSALAEAVPVESVETSVAPEKDLAAFAAPPPEEGSEEVEVPQQAAAPQSYLVVSSPAPAPPATVQVVTTTAPQQEASAAPVVTTTAPAVANVPLVSAAPVVANVVSAAPVMTTAPAVAAAPLVVAPPPPLSQPPQQVAIPIQSAGGGAFTFTPPPAIISPAPLPGTTPIIAVDTSNQALEAQGLAPTTPIRSALRTANAARSGSAGPTRRVSFGSTASTGSTNSQSSSGPVRLNVIKRS
jgi:DNA-directed RNA polymerase II subunit RPB2